MNRPRNPVARSPLLKKGGVHQRSRSGERQQHRKTLKKAIETALRERRPRFWPWILASNSGTGVKPYC